MPSASKTGNVRVKTVSRMKIGSRAAHMRRLGMKPVTVWVPDPDSTRFAAEVARQSRIAAEAPDAADDLAFVESLADETFADIAREEERVMPKPRDDEAR